jgi:hypothetical protein
MRTYGLEIPKTSSGYYEDGSGSLFYFDNGDRSLTLVATPGGGKRYVFRREHDLYGPLYATLFAAGVPSYVDEAEGLRFAKMANPLAEATRGVPVEAPFFAWLPSLESVYKDRKPIVRRPEFWATAGLGVLGVGYFIYSRRAKKA